MSWKTFDREKEQVGLLGCGRMGICMLESMISAGYMVTVYDAFPAAAQKAVSIGAKLAGSASDLAKQATVIIMSLPGPAQLEDVLLGEGGMIAELGEQHIVIDTSTVDPQTTKLYAKQVESKGAAYLDGPILGRPSAVGKWMLPIGGDESALKRAKPILLTFAAKAVRVGDSGAGNALKLLNQMMFSCINAVSAEVLAIADHVGIGKEMFYEVVANSSAATVSGLFRETGKNIVADNYSSPAFTVDLLIKDTKLALQMAKESNAPSVIAGTAQIYNDIAQAQGLGEQDTSALYKVFKSHYKALAD
jgi:3-hydroxyisobutyrate dehydrogenase-like beta-hydroxyacid dehydrogenase